MRITQPEDAWQYAPETLRFSPTMAIRLAYHSAPVVNSHLTTQDNVFLLVLRLDTINSLPLKLA